MTYVPFMANLLVVGNSPEIFRLDLCEGRFYAPLTTKSSQLSACGKDQLCMECLQETLAPAWPGKLLYCE